MHCLEASLVEEENVSILQSQSMYRVLGDVVGMRADGDILCAGEKAPDSGWSRRRFRRPCHLLFLEPKIWKRSNSRRVHPPTDHPAQLISLIGLRSECFPIFAEIDVLHRFCNNNTSKYIADRAYRLLPTYYRPYYRLYTYYRS